MAKAKAPQQRPSNNEIRRIMLQYFYDRNRSATSARGKKGSAVKISDVKKELKTSHGLTQPEVQSNLTYLISQGWVEEDTIEKSFTAPGGTVIPSSTSYYRITAAGIDKIEGPGEFTMPRFHGIKIEATGQNIITLGDGNRINAQFTELGTSLVELRKAITESRVAEATKLALVADIDTIQSQLAKPTPNKSIMAAAWETVKGAAAIDGCTGLVNKVTALIGGLLT
jgi:predicted transcriptional regulator